MADQIQYPVLVSEFGEGLLPYPRRMSEGLLEPGPNEDRALGRCAVHCVCNGWVDNEEVSSTHNALRCRSCGLRVVIPKDVDTFGKLSEHFVEYNK